MTKAKNCLTCAYSQMMEAQTDNEHICCTRNDRWLWPPYYTAQNCMAYQER